MKLQRLCSLSVLLLLTALSGAVQADDDDEKENNERSLRVAPTSVSLASGASAAVQVSRARGTVSVASSDTNLATVSYKKTSSSAGVATIKGRAAGTATITVRDSRSRVRVAVRVTTSTGGGGDTPPPPPPPPTLSGLYTLLAANDLGMHCADQDYQIFSILPPFSVVHAQVVQRGTSSAMPKVLDGTQVDVFYSATSNPNDPAGFNSINSTSQNSPSVFKSNFWQAETFAGGAANTLGGIVYRALYPSTDKLGLCDPASGPCPSVLDLFAPMPGDLGIPVPDPAMLPALAAAQQGMPSITSLNPYTSLAYGANQPQKFARFDVDLPFFANFPFGGVIRGVNWFSADGIPILPVDDLGRPNAYPLMKVQAVAKGATPGATNVLAATDVVLPVASEADCQGCHADPSDFGNGAASSYASVKTYANGSAWQIIQAASAPGPEPLLNAAKINILRLHDAKHGAAYTSSADGSSTPCRSGTEASCLDKRRMIQCSQCHYSPALDLAQAGPIDEKTQGATGRQQARHISMSRAMHGYHGQFTSLFPSMPAPNDPARTAQVQDDVLQQTCYQCHPGKRTQCLRGAMASAGVVCQDCHGNMKQVGNDFSGGLALGQPLDLAKRVPWASEPKCQSCHIGDANAVAQTNLTDFIVAGDGIRLRQAYRKSDAAKEVLPLIQSPASRFAENASLYRLSKGHGGVMCEGCHGSTHAEWPIANPNANDNITATQLQGHAGTITECTVCHAAGSLGLTLNGPHGMHPVNDARWTSSHESVAENNKDACRACHGSRGQGTVLARVAADRVLNGDDGARISLKKGTAVSCNLCHENPL